MLIVFHTCNASQTRGVPRGFEERFMTFQWSTETGTKTASNLTQINRGKVQHPSFPICRLKVQFLTLIYTCCPGARHANRYMHQ